MGTSPPKAFETDDPLELIGISYPTEGTEESDRQTARALIEDFALTGWSAKEIRGLFHSPAYAATFGIARRNGAALVDELIASVFGGGG